MVKRPVFWGAFCCWLLLVTAVAADAQWEESDRSRIGIGAAVLMPANGKVDKDVGTGWFGPTVLFNLRFDEQDRPVSIVTVGFFSKEGPETGFNGSVIPITYSVIKWLDKGNGGGNSGWYAGGGGGAYIGKFDPNQFNFFGEKTTANKIGIHLFGGREFGRGAYAEVRYDLTTRGDDGYSFTGLVASVGIRQAF